MRVYERVRICVIVCTRNIPCNIPRPSCQNLGAQGWFAWYLSVCLFVCLFTCVCHVRFVLSVWRRVCLFVCLVCMYVCSGCLVCLSVCLCGCSFAWMGARSDGEDECRGDRWECMGREVLTTQQWRQAGAQIAKLIILPTRVNLNKKNYYYYFSCIRSATS